MVVFGGTFDPFHSGHLSVVHAVLTRFHRIIVAPTTANPWKLVPPLSLDTRLSVIREFLREAALEPNPELGGLGISLCSLPYEYSEELVRALRTHLDAPLIWAVSEDTAPTVPQWRNWSAAQVPVVVCPITLPLHATQLRSGELGDELTERVLTKTHLYGR